MRTISRSTIPTALGPRSSTASTTTPAWSASTSTASETPTVFWQRRCKDDLRPQRSEGPRWRNGRRPGPYRHHQRFQQIFSKPFLNIQARLLHSLTGSVSPTLFLKGANLLLKSMPKRIIVGASILLLCLAAFVAGGIFSNSVQASSNTVQSGTTIKGGFHVLH